MNLVAPGIYVVQLESVPVPPPGGTVALLVPPRHGGLTRQGDTWFYTPLSSFWTLGTDRFLVVLHTPPNEPEIATVHLVSQVSGSLVSSRGFEIGEEENGWAFMGTAEVNMVGPLSGARSMKVTAGPQETGFAVIDIQPGDTSQGSGATGGWRPPPGSGVEGVVPQFGWSEANLMTFFGAGPEPAALAWVRMRYEAGIASLRLETPNLAQTAPWYPVSSAVHALRLVVMSHPNQVPGSATLWVDGGHVTSVSHAGLTETSIRAGAFAFGLAAVAGDATSSQFDELSLIEIEEWNTAISLDCHDDFESATLAPEWGVVGPNALALESPGLSGEGALAVSPHLGGSSSGGLLIHNSLAPENIRRMGLRLVFNPALLELAVGSTVSIADSANTLATRSFRVLIDRVASGNLRMRVAARHDNPAAPAVVASFPLTAETHTLELDWWRSQTDVEGTGYLRVWLDGVEKANLTGLLNPNQITHEVRFGAAIVAGAPKGKLLLDDIDFWYEN